MIKKLVLALVVAVCLAVSASAQSCPTCYVASNVDAASTSYLAGWGFECGSGTPISRFDAYYYASNGSLVRLNDAYIVNGIWREDVYSYFLNGGGCPSVPISSGFHVYFPTQPPSGSTVVLVLWHGSISAVHYVGVN